MYTVVAIPTTNGAKLAIGDPRFALGTEARLAAFSPDGARIHASAKDDVAALSPDGKHVASRTSAGLSSTMRG
jgi:hypothetical protein